MKTLYLIPARGGSKGIPYKNIKELRGKPLIYYSLDIAREIAEDVDICISTDDQEIIKTVENYGYKVPFIRPEELSTDKMGSYEVIMHALNFYKSIGINYDCLVLLQPTSPFRKIEHLQESLKVFNLSLEMVVSVKEASANPYYGLFEENSEGFLRKSKEGNFFRRQDCPKAWQYNGAIYIMNANALNEKHFSDFVKIKKFEMDELHSVDLDTILDWEWAEFLLEKGYISLP